MSKRNNQNRNQFQHIFNIAELILKYTKLERKGLIISDEILEEVEVMKAKM